jgi:DNA-binding NtrC family response regulator
MGMSDVLKVAEALARAPKLLVVDDDHLIRLVFTRLALQYELDVSCLSSPQEALALLEKNVYDVIFLDMKFEGIGMDGMDMLREINQQSLNTHVVIMSGSVNLHDLMHEANKLGVLSFMLKPMQFSVEYLRRLLTRLHIRMLERKAVE